MQNGNVKWFNEEKRYGFIQPDNGGADIFVHLSAVEASGLRTLRDGDRVQYETAEQKGRLAAVKLRVIG